jgi:sugar phosphate isomerase/epimerase
MQGPYIHVPFDRIDDYRHFIEEHRINLEVYFSSRTLDCLRDSDIMELKEKFAYTPSFTIHAPFMDLSPGAVDEKVRAVTIGRFSHIMDIAEIMAPKSVVFHSGYEKWKYALKVDLWLEKSMETWAPLSRRARDMGLKIAIENIFEDEPSNLRLLMDEMGSDHFGICFDTGHFNLFSKIPLAGWLGLLMPYIHELHLHDNNRTSDEHLAIGKGTFDFAALFSFLKERELIYTIEGHTPEDVLESIERLNKYF